MTKATPIDISFGPASMREQIGRDRAEALLDAHESSPLDPANETKIDKFNNSKGIEVVLDYSK